MSPKSLLLSLMLLITFQVSAECFEEDNVANELEQFIINEYQIKVANAPLQMFECADNFDYFRVLKDDALIFELTRLPDFDTFDYKARLVKNYDDPELNEIWMKELLDLLKLKEGKDWKYFIATSWRGNCGGCMALHQFSVDGGFKYHGRIFLYPQTMYSNPSLKKIDANGNVIYDEEINL